MAPRRNRSATFVAHEAAGRRQFTPFEHARYCFAGDEVHNLLSVLEGQTVPDEEKPVWTLSGHHGKNAFEVCRASHFLG
jgi:hypothetical protein